MATDYTDQFYVMDPGNAPPAGSALQAQQFTFTDRNDNGIIRPGEAQRMSAGSGILHSEMNASQSEPVHFLQMWVPPDQRDLEPGYESAPCR